MSHSMCPPLVGGCVGLTKTDVLQNTMLVRYISTGVLGVTMWADIVDSVHIMCVCGGGVGWCVCLHMYIHIIHSTGKIMLLQSDHSYIYVL